MFTIDQIAAAHARVQSGADFPAYVHALKTLGVTRYETHVPDGHTTYYGAGNFRLQGSAKYALLPVAGTAAAARLQEALRDHQAGRTDYLTFCRQAAAAGVRKWAVYTARWTCTYLSEAGERILEERIPQPEV